MQPAWGTDAGACSAGSKFKAAVLVTALVCVACGLTGQPWSLARLVRKTGLSLAPLWRDQGSRAGSPSRAVHWLSEGRHPGAGPAKRALRMGAKAAGRAAGRVERPAAQVGLCWH